MIGKILTKVTIKTVVFWNVPLKNDARYSSTGLTGTADECSKIQHDTDNDDVMNIILFDTDCKVQVIDVLSFSFKPVSLLKYSYFGL
jgi:hypothetical protein